MRRNEQELKNEAVIPILPMVSVFLFPGSSLPMRIRQTAWVDYLTEAIAESRKILGSQVRIGIVTLTRDRSMTLDDENCVVGMIGTFATITYIHEGETRDYDTADIPGQRARPNIHPREIVVTMVGT
jgi:Lon protease-like protein